MVKDVTVPGWLHGYIIGKSGSNIKLIHEECPHVNNCGSTVCINACLRTGALPLHMIFFILMLKTQNKISEMLDLYILHQRMFFICTGNGNLFQVHIEFHDDQNTIILEGPPDEVVKAEAAIMTNAEELVNCILFTNNSVSLSRIHTYLPVFLP